MHLNEGLRLAKGHFVMSILKAGRKSHLRAFHLHCNYAYICLKSRRGEMFVKNTVTAGLFFFLLGM